MNSPTLYQCCCGSSLGAGTTAIAWIHLLSAFLYLQRQTIMLRFDITPSDKGFYEQIFAFTVTVILFLTPITLLIGIIKKHPGLVLTWIVITSVEMLIGIYTCFLRATSINNSSFVIILIFLLFAIISYMYIMIVVINFRRLLIAEKRGIQINEFEDSLKKNNLKAYEI